MASPEQLLARLDALERQIEAERARRGGWKGAVVAFAATFDLEPFAEVVAARRRLRKLEAERRRLLEPSPCPYPPTGSTLGSGLSAWPHRR